MCMPLFQYKFVILYFWSSLIICQKIKPSITKSALVRHKQQGFVCKLVREIWICTFLNILFGVEARALLLLTNATKFLFILTYAPKVRDRNYLWDMSKFDYKMCSLVLSPLRKHSAEEEKIHFVKSNN